MNKVTIIMRIAMVGFFVMAFITTINSYTHQDSPSNPILFGLTCFFILIYISTRIWPYIEQRRIRNRN
jgi:hypothetical protein